jgi:hypothetical protein
VVKDITKSDKTKIAVVIAILVVLAASFNYNSRNRSTSKSDVANTSAGNHAITDEMKKIFTDHVLSISSAKWSVVSMKYDAMCDGSEAFDVAMKSDTGATMSHILDRKGAFIQSEVDKEIISAPKALSDALAANFAGYSHGDTYEDLTMANGEARYLVDITKDGGMTTAEAIISAEGKTICQTTPK